MPCLETITRRLAPALAALILAAAPTFASAEEERIGQAVSVELNAAKSTESACTLSFLVINGHATQIDALVYETVLFDTGGQVERLTLFDFGALPPARPRVRQFSVPGITCDGLGKILINGASTCDGADLAPDACETGLILSSRTGIEVQG